MTSDSVATADADISTPTAGLLVPRVPEVYLPLKQCIEILGASLKPRSAQAILEHCLQGLAQKVRPLIGFLEMLHLAQQQQPLFPALCLPQSCPVPTATKQCLLHSWSLCTAVKMCLLHSWAVSTASLMCMITFLCCVSTASQKRLLHLICVWCSNDVSAAFLICVCCSKAVSVCKDIL